MMYFKKTVTLVMMLAIILTLTSCANDTEKITQIEAELIKLQETNQELKSEIEALKSELKTSTSKSDLRFTFIENTYRELAETIENGKPAYISAYSEGYSVTKTDIGSMLVTVTDIEEYLTGYNLYLAFGNPNNITLNGAKVIIACKKDSKDQNPVVQEFDITDKLDSGEWTTSKFTLKNISSEKLSVIEVTIIPDNIALYN